MCSFRKTRDLLAVAVDDGYVNEEEFLLQWDVNTSKNLDFPVHTYSKFVLDEKNASEVKAEFRFEKNDIPTLFDVLRIPEEFTCRQGTVPKYTNYQVSLTISKQELDVRYRALEKYYDEDDNLLSQQEVWGTWKGVTTIRGDTNIVSTPIPTK
ncbi:Hypothetical predicted protein [Paramuricea clavata]|uniref:Uncharacterized protein n=1 Tax=Paramuricea clavata TaxID=317549 RepID=A0A7D9HPI3_PARCT|nr:Hypothetical predicted protein [Paramuricea clavata]